MEFAIIACVLALTVPLAVGAVLLTLARKMASNVHSSLSDSVERLNARCGSIESKLVRTSESALADAVDALRADLERLETQTHARLGTLWGRIGADEQAQVSAKRVSKRKRNGSHGLIPPPTLGSVPLPRFTSDEE